jgi:long-chain acyl-CoA synthetase
VLHEQQLSKPVEETIVALPLSYTFAFVNQWVWSRCHRSRLVMTAGWAEPLELRGALKHARNAMICLVGAQVPLLATCFSGCTFGGVIRVHFAGGRFPQERIDEVRAFFPNAMIFNNYGCAEAMPRLTLRQADEAAEASDIGRPLPGVRLRAGKDGSLAFQSPYGAVGFMDSRGFRSIGPDEWVPTGDLGEPTGHGTWRLTGRACEVFKRYGEKVSIPSVLAGVLRRWDGQALSYREADRTGEDGWVLVLGPTPTPEQVRAILAGLRADHPRTRWPLRIESLDSLPVLASGKPDVRAATAYTNRRIHWQQRI